MSTQTIKGAVDQQQTGALAVIEQHRSDLSLVLPSHINGETWVRVAMGAIRKSADLWKACNETPGSMMSALMESAQLGLNPGTDEYYLTPRKIKQKDGRYRWEVVGIVGYIGEIELIYRAGAVSSVICELVCQGETFIWTPGKYDISHNPPRWQGPQMQPYHEVPDWFDDRGGVERIRGSYCYCIMKDGAISKVAIAGKNRIARAMEASGTADASHSPWKSDYGAMVLKTAVHEEAKFVPTSAEYRRELHRAEREVAGVTGGRYVPLAAPVTPEQFMPTTPPPSVAPYVDGEVVAPTPIPAPAPVAPDQAPARPAAADPTTQKPNRGQLRTLDRLLSLANVKTPDAQLRLVAHVLERDDLTSLDQLTSNEVSRLIARLEQLKSEGQLGQAQQSDDPPADQTPTTDSTEGEQP